MVATPSHSVTSPDLPLFIPATSSNAPDVSNPKTTTNKLKASSFPRESSPLVKNEQLDEEMSADPEALLEIKDDASRATVVALLNEHGLRGGRKTSEQNQTPEPPTISKKTKKATKAVTKKGTARKTTKKKAAPVRPGTPSKVTKTTPKKETSATPARSSSPVVPDEDEDMSGDEDVDASEDDQLYCICRKPDDHKYMIGCDGGCDNWFHGKCVNITEEDGKLIDKYICPNCMAKGIGITTWKPMCRRVGCRKPARVMGEPPSKYCSDACGTQFFQEIITKSERDRQALGKGKNGKRKHDEDGISMQRGGPLDSSLLKSLLQHVNTAHEFRNLGKNVLSKVPSDVSAALTDSSDISTNPILTQAEHTELRRMTEKKETLRLKRAALKDRERFITLIKDQWYIHAENEGLKSKDVCGYDTRLAWGAEQFDRWKASPAGKYAMENSTLVPAPTTNGVKEDEEENEKPAATDADGDVDMSDTPHVNVQPDPHPICTRKRCERHKKWFNIALEEVRYDESALADQVRETERVERQVRETALLRWREDQAYRLAGNGSIIPADQI